ncbi:MAG: choice-of-anchor B family protein [Gemmatimonadota bacterium]
MHLPRPVAIAGVLSAGALTLLLAAPAPAAAQQLYDFGTAFGRAAAVAGSDLLVAEPQNVIRPGRVYVFRPGVDAWVESGVLTASDAVRSDGFGRALAATTDAALVGAPQAGEGAGAAYLFVRDGAEWREAARLGDSGDATNTGSAVALSGQVAAVVEQTSEGERVRAYWRSEAALDDGALLEAQPGDQRFGAALAALDGGGLLVCGADADGMVVLDLFLRSSTGAWRRADRATLPDRLSAQGGLLSQDPYKECGLSASDGMAAVGVPLAGAGEGRVALYRIGPNGELVPDTTLTPPEGATPGFGTAVALSGGTLWVGAPTARAQFGAAIRFQRNGDGWGEGEVITGPGSDFMPVFGLALAAGPDLAVVGSPGDAYGAGVAVAYEREGTTWSEAGTLLGETEGYEAVRGETVDCTEGEAAIFTCDQMDLVSLLPVHEMGAARGAMVNDVWGWTDPTTGREYAVVGRSDGTSFVDVTDPTRPVYLGQLPKTEGSRGQAWRDVKVIRNHALVVADNAGQHGMQVFDMTRLRDVDPADPPTFEADALYTEIASAHNLIVNEETGFAYTVGNSGGGRGCGSIHMIDMRDPKSPTFAGCYTDPTVGLGAAGQTHDAQCVLYRGPDEAYRGRELCIAFAETAISIGDVTDKSAPVIVSRASMPNTAYIHQGWLTEDHRYMYVNDELDEMNGLTDRTRTMIWDIAEIDDPVLAGFYFAESNATDHNLYVRGDLMYQSNYAAGLRVIDVSDPENPHEVGYFDTAPFAEDAPGFFDGSWSNYPFFQSGNILVTSHKQGLFLLRRRVPIS